MKGKRQWVINTITLMLKKQQALDLQHQLYYICRVNAINFELSNL